MAKNRMKSIYDFADKIEYYNEKTKLYNTILFKELKPQAVSLLNKISPQSRTRLYYGNVRLLEDGMKSPGEGNSDSEDLEEIPKLPVYVFLPSKSELMKMILKAAYTDLKNIENIQTVRTIQSVGAVPTPSQMDNDYPASIDSPKHAGNE